MCIRHTCNINEICVYKLGFHLQDISLSMCEFPNTQEKNPQIEALLVPYFGEGIFHVDLQPPPFESG